ncbi:hypothetical protein [Alsobacter soli]|uniref:hypothetical protein n=1 Tax=Alsobacter soli TaxID=2109933 RepID=UPI0011B28F4F|nr:hypothetical protein [Alsobacter soli]
MVSVLEATETRWRSEAKSLLRAQEQTATALRDAIGLISDRLDGIDRSIRDSQQLGRDQRAELLARDHERAALERFSSMAAAESAPDQFNGAGAFWPVDRRKSEELHPGARSGLEPILIAKMDQLLRAMSAHHPREAPPEAPRARRQASEIAQTRARGAERDVHMHELLDVLHGELTGLIRRLDGLRPSGDEFDTPDAPDLRDRWERVFISPEDRIGEIQRQFAALAKDIDDAADVSRRLTPARASAEAGRTADTTRLEREPARMGPAGRRGAV